MKRVFALIGCAAVLLAALAACGKTKPYGWEIQTTLEESRGGIEFKFSRPVFSGASPLVETANRVYDKMEAEYISKMNAEGANPTDETWNYTELSGFSYIRDDVLCFVTDGDWYMGGVHNSWVTGHTFDFNLGRELKLSDFVRGDEEEIRAALMDAFVQEIASFGDGEPDLSDARAQSGPDANFYLTADGVYVFYMPYVVPATQNGVTILIPWDSPLIG